MSAGLRQLGADGDGRYDRRKAKEGYMRTRKEMEKQQLDRVNNARFDAAVSDHARTAKAASATKATRTTKGKHDQSDAIASLAECPQCHASSHVFYCSVCLSERIVSHHVNVLRLDDMRAKSRAKVQRLLGIDADTKATLAAAKRKARDDGDPFGDQTQKRFGVIDEQRSLRADQANLTESVRLATSRTHELRQIQSIKRKQIDERRRRFEKRREFLARANAYFPSADEGECSTQFTLSPTKVDRLRDEIALLSTDGKEMAMKLAETRSILAREVFSLFCVSPPQGTMAEARTTTGKAHGAGGLGARTQRSRERYVPGAFLFDTGTQEGRNARIVNSLNDDTHKVPSHATSNDWTIMDLVLPPPADIRRFARGKVNGALAHTVHLLHLLSTYLGTMLPFVIASTSGVPHIRPNTLWGSGVRHSLYLSTNTYNAFSAPESKLLPAGLSSMGTSMISNLGASTFSTLESFVHLPGGNAMPWSKNADAVASDAKERKADGRNTTEEKTSSAAKQFITGLTMLAYDVAYLAHCEGLSIDLLNAAGSPLRLLSKIVNSAKLGQRAHTTSYAKLHINDLTFAQIDFVQLAQLFEAGSVHKTGPSLSISAKNRTGEGAKLASKDSKAPGLRSGPISVPKRVSANAPILEGSYIDARQAAQSILVEQSKSDGRRGPSDKGVTETTPKTSAISARASEEKRSSLARHRVAPSQPLVAAMPALAAGQAPRPATLDFLRAPRGSSTPTTVTRKEGEKAFEKTVNKSDDKAHAKAKSSDRKGLSGQTPAGIGSSTSSGTVLFNGKEVKARSHSDEARKGEKGSSRTSSRRSTNQKHADDDDWAVL